MDRSILTANLVAPVSRLDIIRNHCRGKAVLDIGCVQHDACHAVSTGWLHQVIVDVAGSVLGVDYLEDEVRKLNKCGYHVIVADVSKPLALDTQFDVIVVGNLIEHLSNFEGLLLNIRRLLKPGGRLLISTANPFYREQYFYSAFKNDILVNPEHTCWIDPTTLDQLCQRFGLVTDEVHWIREKWSLGQVILNGDVREYDMFAGRWVFHKSPTRIEALLSLPLFWIFKFFFPKSYTKRVLNRYGDETRRLLYLRLVQYLFNWYWILRRLLIVTSPINRYELFVSVLRLQTDTCSGLVLTGTEKVR